MSQATFPIISQNGIDLIKSFESCRLQAYLCPAHRLTIGYGHVLKPKEDAALFKNMSTNSLNRLVDKCQKYRTINREDQKTLTINQEQADALLKSDTQKTALYVHYVTKINLSMGQFDALCSLIFNIGEGNYSRSTLLKKLNAGDYLGAADEFTRWAFATVNGQKQLLPGLVKRRAAERALFLKE